MKTSMRRRNNEEIEQWTSAKAVFLDMGGLELSCPYCNSLPQISLSMKLYVLQTAPLTNTKQ